jgi:hypothetical protein
MKITRTKLGRKFDFGYDRELHVNISPGDDPKVFNIATSDLNEYVHVEMTAEQAREFYSELGELLKDLP